MPPRENIKTAACVLAVLALFLLGAHLDGPSDMEAEQATALAAADARQQARDEFYQQLAENGK